jgi:hypothetical protein
LCRQRGAQPSALGQERLRRTEVVHVRRAIPAQGGALAEIALDARMDRVRAELVTCFALAGGSSYTSNERRPLAAEWRREWNAIAATVAQGMADAERDATGPAYRMARARLRRWDHHTSVVDLAWEAA